MELIIIFKAPSLNTYICRIIPIKAASVISYVGLWNCIVVNYAFYFQVISCVPIPLYPMN